MDVSVVIPARNEGDISGLLSKISLALSKSYEHGETIVVVDTEDDTTWPAVVSYYGHGPANAIKFGIDHAQGDVIVVMCADGSDDPETLPWLVALVEHGAAVGCASRYMAGGRHIGGPRLKHFLSWLAGTTLWLAGAGTHDPTNAYKAYRADFLTRAGVESSHGFEMGIEMVAKARRLGLTVAETPTTWRDRTSGTSHFRMSWVPDYLRWYIRAL